MKSSSKFFESVEHVIGSSPVTVNVKVLLLELPAPRRRVTTGARLSAATVVVVVVVVVVAATVVVVAAIEVVVAVALKFTKLNTLLFEIFWFIRENVDDYPELKFFEGLDYRENKYHT